MDTRTVACITMTATADTAENLMKAEYLIEQAIKQKADWILLPEMFSYMGGYEHLPSVATKEGHSLCQRLAALARLHKKTIFAGMPETPPNSDTKNKVYNSLFVFGPDGSLLHVYRKIHLFHLRYGDHTRSEEDGFLAGHQLLNFNHEGWQIACGICYDLRFPEMFVALNQIQRFDVLVLPSAFTAATGAAHWHLLLKARAVEHQAYVLAPNQTGTHSEGKSSYGHSLIVDPWGTVLADSGHQPGLALATIYRKDLETIRQRIPIEKNRRKDLFRA